MMRFLLVEAVLLENRGSVHRNRECSSSHRADGDKPLLELVVGGGSQFWALFSPHLHTPLPCRLWKPGPQHGGRAGLLCLLCSDGDPTQCGLPQPSGHRAAGPPDHIGQVGGPPQAFPGKASSSLPPPLQVLRVLPPLQALGDRWLKIRSWADRFRYEKRDKKKDDTDQAGHGLKGFYSTLTMESQGATCKGLWSLPVKG